MKFLSTLYIFIITLLLISLLTKGVRSNIMPSDVYSLKDYSQPFELSPERGRYALTQSIVENHSLFLPLEIAGYVTPDLGYINGNFVSLFAPGVSFVVIPFYYIGKYFNANQLFTFWSVGLAAVINAYIISDIVNRITKSGFGYIAGLSFIFATSALAYATTLYQHHFTTLIILLALHITIFSNNTNNSLLMGVLFGVMLLIEYPAVIFLLPIILVYMFRHYCSLQNKESFKISIDSRIMLFILYVFIGIIPTLIYNSYVNTNPFKLSGTVESVENININNNGSGYEIIKGETDEFKKSVGGFFKYENIANSWYILLLSSERGILFYSPLYLLTILIFNLKNKISDIEKYPFYLLVSINFAVLLLYGMWGDPWGGWAFGPRYLIPFFAFSSILLGIVFKYYAYSHWFKLSYFTLLVYSILINVAGALTTNAIVPSKEAESALMPTIKYLYNFELIGFGKSSSFIYNTYFSKYIPLTVFYILIIAIIVFLLFLANKMSSDKISHEN
ncbi:MAG: hypothetical protein UT06_C0001G0057 [Candidatus Woesebacteria bacterium GW2011_GWA1_38_8]|uniref:Glycosyltransferase RgtA/B/C/D-like domain-containing protein n=1 Tax=Candidatus Woesebacteria bacterium GW2011_GWA1_38_8 TaxID=1618547 RepID=A0A0G0L1C3_9BACT|nr:MAG: hypothetical protein UT06_C0001G0057 [Candidatus Woesebacteria bacterium GW2011_GWA1_38_8]